MTKKLTLILAFCALTAACAPSTPPVAANANTPGWTGTTVVKGSTSTLAGNAAATYYMQKWPIEPTP